MFSRKKYSAEEADHELFARFSHDVAQCMKALDFLAAQNTRISAQYWPAFLNALFCLSEQFAGAMGENSLEFEGISEFYKKFDFRHAQATYFRALHPKERTSFVPGIAAEVATYSQMAASLENEMSAFMGSFSRDLASRVQAISVHLKHIQSRIKLRDSLHAKCLKMEKTVSKLDRKVSQIDAKDFKTNGTELNEARAQLASVSARYTALNTKLKATLPESLLLVEEFVSSLVSWTLGRHHEILEKITRRFRSWCQFYGFLDPRDNREIEDLGSIVDQWELGATATRLRVESLLSAIHDKNPDLWAKEVAGKEPSPAITKAWSKMSSKTKQHHHEVKPKDRSAGIFHNHQVADPLVSYVQFQDPAVNVSETYHPYKYIHRKDPSVKGAQSMPEAKVGTVSKTASIATSETFANSQSKAKTEPVSISEILTKPLAKNVPPPLPPRDERTLQFINRPVNAASRQVPSTPPGPGQTWSSMSSSPDSHGNSHGNGGPRSRDSPRSASQLSLASHLDGTVVSSVDVPAPENLFSDIASEKISKLYNRQKNEIMQAPMLPSANAFSARFSARQSAGVPDVSSLANSSETLKVHAIRLFYERLVAADCRFQVRMAKKSFSGDRPGDLSLEPGDKIEIVYDLQSNAMTYDANGDNWVLGATGDASKGLRRVGFLPGTCL